MENIVVIAVEKIQRYIFQNIDETKKDAKTLSNVIKASNRVAEDILKDIGSQFSFSSNKMDLILSISGKLIFKWDSDKNEIEGKLKDLFQRIYIKYNGNIFLKYAVFQSEANDKLKIIHQANDLLKDPKTKSDILQSNREVLFKFCECTGKDDTRNESSDSGIFLDTMDQLVVLDEKHESDSTDGKIAIVKADINNLGKIMSSISSYKDYSKLSKLLEEAISMDRFGNYVENYSVKSSNDQTEKDYILVKKILPFYIAGDDIFYAVRIDGVLDSIKVLHTMMMAINREIKNQVSNVNVELSIAVGVVFVNNHQPIRYYRQMVEKELSISKHQMKTVKPFGTIVGINLAGNHLNIYKNALGIGESDGFMRFCQEIKELKMLMQKKVFTNTALHNLLVTLEMETDEEKQLYDVLYFLKPTLQKGQKANEELYVKYYWLSQLVEDKRSGQGQAERYFDLSKIQKQFIPKLKVTLLFLRDRYSHFTEEETFSYKYIIGLDKKDQEMRMRSVMFHKPINHLLKSLNNNDYTSTMVSLFFGKSKPQKGEKKDKKVLFLSGKFNRSIFYRAKNLIQEKKAKQVVTLFENYDRIFNKENENQKESVHNIGFDIHKFKMKFDKNSRDTRWLDIIILLYYYNEQRIIIKTKEKSDKRKTKDNKSAQSTGSSAKIYRKQERNSKIYGRNR